MKRNPVAAALIATVATSFAASQAASAEPLPPVKISSTNKMPECATPGRIMAMISERNPKLDPRYANIATLYMRHGEDLGIRWDYGFFQMILETGSLAYKRGNGKPGDVKPSQNNFAGLGATGGGAPGETFASIDAGVKAHLQHLLMYTGEKVTEPVAERTRNVQQWGVLTNWQKGFKRPITFADVAGKWAPGSRGYVGDMKSIAADFYDDHCKKADPKPEMVREARSGGAGGARTAGQTLAQAANQRARSEGDGKRSALGAQGILGVRPAAAATPPSQPQSKPQSKDSGEPAVTILNEPEADKPQQAVVAAAAPMAKAPAGKSAAATPPLTQAAASVTSPLAAAAMPKAAPPAQAGKCRVFTASYGGQKAVIIRAPADGFTNFTVLDVNEGQESREVEAYIAAYAKGGQRVGAFSNSNSALEEAFKLCPEG